MSFSTGFLLGDQAKATRATSGGRVMPYLLLMFVHVGAMFAATSLAIGPIVVFVLVLRAGDVNAIRRTFAYSHPIAQVGGAFYGLGVLFGILTALNGAIDLASPWLVTGYILVVLLAANGLY